MKIYCDFCVLYNFPRLDFAINEILQISRSQIIQWIEKDLVFVNEKKVKKSKPIKKTDRITLYSLCTIPTKQDDSDEIKHLNIEVIYENNDFLILNKPRNLIVHHAPSVKEQTLTDYLKSKNYNLSTINGEKRFGIVHRLDKDTSGTILIAKNNQSHIKFANMLKERSMGRIYICVINKPLKEDVCVECFIGRNPNNRLKMAKLDKNKFPQARDSKSEFRKIIQSNIGTYELIGVRLFSGRTHQIRVHLSTLGRYIYGDVLYSPESLVKQYHTKMLLHAKILYFEDSLFIAKIPKDLVKFLEENFLNYQNKLKSFLEQWKKELIYD